MGKRVRRALTGAGFVAALLVAGVHPVPVAAQTLTGIRFPGQTIASAGALGPSQTAPVVATATSNSKPDPGATIYIEQYGHVSGDVTLVPASQCGGASQLTVGQFTACTTDSNGEVVMTYRAPADPPAVGEGDWYAQDSPSNYHYRATTHYVYSTNLRFSPSPIAPGGSLGAGTTTPVTLSIENALDQGMPNDIVYLSFKQASGGGSAYVGSTQLTSSPVLFTANGSGDVALQYDAPATLPTSGVDQIIAQVLSGSAVNQNVDDYSFGAAPVVSIGDAGVAQGRKQPGIPADFTITVTPVQPNPVSVQYTTSCGIGDKWCSEDFRVDPSSPITATIPANTSSTKIIVRQYSYLGSGSGENYNEGWFVHLSNPTESSVNVVLGRSVGEGIEYPDVASTSPPALFVGSAGLVPTTDAGGAPIYFTVTLSAPTSSDVTFSYATSDGSAHAGVDYKAKQGTATIASGKNSVVIPVTILPNAPPGSDLTFTLTISNASGGLTIVQPQDTGTILIS
jgi:Calx-beta domain